MVNPCVILARKRILDRSVFSNAVIIHIVNAVSFVNVLNSVYVYIVQSLTSNVDSVIKVYANKDGVIFLIMVKRRVVKRKAKRKPSRKDVKFSKAIQSLQRLKPSQRCVAIRHANDKFIRDIVSHVRKLRRKKLSAKMNDTIKKHAKTFRLIANPKVSLKRKRKTLSQKGGFGPLFSILAPVAGSLIGSLVRKIVS